MKKEINKKNGIDLSFFNSTEISEVKGIPEKDIEEWKERLTSSREYKKIRFVSEWIWWDIIMDESSKKIISKHGLKSAAIYSHNLIWDEIGDFSPGFSVKTSLLESFEEDALFITRNTTYVLVGPGHRADISAQVFSGIHF
jgi:hypothetical protein